MVLHNLKWIDMVSHFHIQGQAFKFNKMWMKATQSVKKFATYIYIANMSKCIYMHYISLHSVGLVSNFEHTNQFWHGFFEKNTWQVLGIFSKLSYQFGNGIISKADHCLLYNKCNLKRRVMAHITHYITNKCCPTQICKRK